MKWIYVDRTQRNKLLLYLIELKEINFYYTWKETSLYYLAEDIYSASHMEKFILFTCECTTSWEMPKVPSSEQSFYVFSPEEFKVKKSPHREFCIKGKMFKSFQEQLLPLFVARKKKFTILIYVCQVWRLFFVSFKYSSYY